MIAGLGHDVVDVVAFRALVGIDAASRFAEATFTEGELRYCRREALGEPALHLAGRFAAKEAGLKALDAAAGLLDVVPPHVAMRDIEVLRDGRGRPSLRFHGDAHTLAEALEIRRVFVSLSHDGDVASAVVVLAR